VISGLHRGVNAIFAFFGCYAAQISSYWRFGTTYRSQLQGLGSQELLEHWRWAQRRLVASDVSGQSTPTFKGPAVQFSFRSFKMGRMDCSETSVTTNLRCATSQNSEDLSLRSSLFWDPCSSRQVLFQFRHKAASYLGWSEEGYSLRSLGFNAVDFMSYSWRRNTAPGVSQGSFAFPLQTIIQPLLYTNTSDSTRVRNGPDQAAYLLL